MAKDLNVSTLSVVEVDGALRAVIGGKDVRLGAVYMDGERVEGVFAELRDGGIEALAAEGAIAVPSGVSERDALLKKWSDAAKKASKAKKAGGASLLLLSLAACGGGGGTAVEVPVAQTASVDASNDIIQIAGAVAGAVVTIVSALAGADTYSNVEVVAQGEGTLTLSFEDADDVVVLSADTDISGFDTIVVEHGTVDFTSVDLPASITVLQVGSEAILSFGDYMQLDVELRQGATEGSVTVVADTFANILSIDGVEVATGVTVSIETSTELSLTVAQAEDLAGVTADFVGDFKVVDTADALLGADAAWLVDANAVEVTGGDAGALSVANVVALRAVTTNDSWSFDVVDSVANIFDGDNVKPSVREILLQADSVSVSGELNDIQVAALEVLNSSVEVAPYVTSIEISDAALSIGDSATVTVTFSEAVTGLEIDDFVAQNAELSGLSDAINNQDGTQTYTLTMEPTASIEDTTNVVSLAAGKVIDSANNTNAGSAVSNNYTVDTIAPSAPSVAPDNDTGIADDGISSDGTINVSGLESGATWEYSLNGGSSWAAGTGTTFTLAEGSYAAGDILVRQYDAAGNVGAVNQNPEVVTIDSSDPTIVSLVLDDNSLFVDADTQTTAASEQATVTITFAEAVQVSDLTVGDFTVANGTLSNLTAVNASDDGYASQFTVTLTADNLSAPDATNTIQLEANSATDRAGNFNVASSVVNFAIDRDVSANWSEFVSAETLSIDGVEDAGQPSTLTITAVPDGARVENDEARLFNVTTAVEQNAIRGVEHVVFEVASGTVDFDLGANAEAAGIDKVSITGGYATSILNLGGRNSGVEVVTGAGDDQITGSNYADVIASGAGQDALLGGQGNDTFKFATAELQSNDVVDGGTGDDTIEITDNASLVDADFTQVSSVEALKLSGTGSNTVDLGGEVNQSGIRTIDATASTVGSTLDVADMTSAVTVLGGSGNDTITGGAGNDSLLGNDGDDYIVANQSDVKIDGGTGIDTVEFAQSVGTPTLSDTDLVNVENVLITNTNTGSRINYDFRDQTEGLNITAGDGAEYILVGNNGAVDTVNAGGANDHIFADDTDVIDGGSGSEDLLKLGSARASELTDDDLQNVEIIEVNNAYDGAVFDFSVQSEALEIRNNAYNYSNVTVIGGSAADTFKMGSGSETIVASDTDALIDGGAGTDTVQFGAAVSAANLQDVNGGVKFGHCGGAKVGQFGASALERAALI